MIGKKAYGHHIYTIIAREKAWNLKRPIELAYQLDELEGIISVMGPRYFLNKRVGQLDINLEKICILYQEDILKIIDSNSLTKGYDN